MFREGSSEEQGELGSEIEISPSTLYTTEITVYQGDLDEARVGDTILGGKDSFGNHFVTDGNHRAIRSMQLGRSVRMRVIAMSSGNISQDDDFRPLSKVKVKKGKGGVSDFGKDNGIIIDHGFVVYKYVH